MSAHLLAVLERSREDFSPGAAQRKLAALRVLARARLTTAEQVRRLHEVLCFMRAYPDSAAVLRAVERMLQGFARRQDLRAQREALEHTGIAGTAIWFPFFYPTVRWIAQRWPDALRLDRNDTVAEESIAKALPALLSPLESHALREAHLPGYRALDALRGRRTDATFLVERVAAMPGDEVTRETFYDLINPSCELHAATGTPSRTTAIYPRAPRAWQTTPLRRARPDLRAELARPPRSLRHVSASEGQALVTLAREAMLTRQRDLDAFAHGHAADVWLCEDGGGLAFALIGSEPQRRVPLPAIYGGLTLYNGVPLGYLQADLLGRSVAVSFNTFETFRGGESAHTFARALAALRAFGGATSFSIEPYQLGQGNDEGIDSGAWWFYFKLGFRPRARAALRLAAIEAQQQRAQPGYRSAPETLRQLAAHHVFLDLDANHPAPLLLPTHIGLRVGAHLATLAPEDRAAAVERASTEALRRCGLDSLQGFTRDQRAAWLRLAPLFAALPMSGWTAAERAALVPLARAKGARSERGYARLTAAHARLEQALAAWSSPADRPSR
jgi:hypothetical protein